jgi:hypothetical protein
MVHLDGMVVFSEMKICSPMPDQLLLHLLDDHMGRDQE